MAICGYNEKIDNGLKLLVEGMIDALEKKMEGGSVTVVLQRELVELDNIIAAEDRPGENLARDVHRIEPSRTSALLRCPKGTPRFRQ